MPSTTPSPLEELDRLLSEKATPPSDRAQARQQLNAVAAALYETVTDESPAPRKDPIRAIFDTQLHSVDRELLTATLLRMLVAHNSALRQDTEAWGHIWQYFDKELPPGLYEQLGVGQRDQTYEKDRALQKFIADAERDAENLLEHYADLTKVANLHERLMRQVNSKRSGVLIRPFLPRILVKARLSELFRKIEDFNHADSPATFKDAYTDVVESANKFITDCEGFRTRYARWLLIGPIDRILADAQDIAKASVLTQPAELIIEESKRTYPLQSNGAEFSLPVEVTNRGPGLASNVLLEIQTLDAIDVRERQLFLGSLEPGFYRFKFDCRVSEVIESALAEVSIEWLDGASPDSRAADIIFDLHPQPAGIEFDQLQYSNPYELEPVRRVDDLVGRRTILQQLVAGFRARSMGSAFLYGQKRVGKTSIALATTELLQRDGFCDCAVFLESGQFASPSAEATVASIGRLVSEAVRVSDTRLMDVPVPLFETSLSPLSEFFSAVWRAIPDYRVLIVLDEFDELPAIDLYRRGSIGDAFFLAIRSLSSQPNLGFLLVGSQRMDHVIAMQGQALNKFTKLDVGSFDRNTDWDDYVELVRRPSQGTGIHWDEASALELYRASAGNPFFTKLICSRAFSEAVDRRDAHISASEVSVAFDHALGTVGAHHFSHFWEDGILDLPARRDEISTRRRKLLLAYSECATYSEKVPVENLVDGAVDWGVAQGEVVDEVRGFVRRGVMTGDPSGEVGLRMPFFERWLRESGRSEIITEFGDRDAIIAYRRDEEEKRVKAAEIREVLEQWGTYRGREITPVHVTAWLDQFERVEEQRLMFQLLAGLQFVRSDRLREILSDHRSIALAGTRQDLDASRFDHILLTYFGKAGKSGSGIVRTFATENRIYVRNIVPIDRLKATIANDEKIQRVIVIDDFVGTGRSVLNEGQLEVLDEAIGDLVRDGRIDLRLVFISGFEDALDIIEARAQGISLPLDTYVFLPLGPQDKCFGESSRYYQAPDERIRAREIALRCGEQLDPKRPLGYGGGELAIVFPDTVPNNCLPILWKQRGEWEPLFPRF